MYPECVASLIYGENYYAYKKIQKPATNFISIKNFKLMKVKMFAKISYIDNVFFKNIYKTLWLEEEVRHLILSIT